MKAVILAAGRGLRMNKLTDELPKPLLSIAGKTLLEHKLDLLPGDIKEIIIVIYYLGFLIQEKITHTYRGIPVRYVKSSLKGTAQALFDAKKYLKGEFIVMAGDDLYHKSDIEDMIKSREWAVQVFPVFKETSGGIIEFKNNKFVGVSEGRHISGHIATSFYKLDDRIFNYKKVSILSGEYGLPQTIASAKDDVEIRVMLARTWVQIGDPGHLDEAKMLFNTKPDFLEN